MALALGTHLVTVVYIQTNHSTAFSVTVISTCYVNTFLLQLLYFPLPTQHSAGWHRNVSQKCQPFKAALSSAVSSRWPQTQAKHRPQQTQTF